MKSVYRLFSVMCFSLLLAACGGSGNELSNGNDNPTDPNPDPQPQATLTLALHDANGSTITEVSQSNPGTLSATLTVDGSGVANALISFSLESVGSLSPAVGTALTNSNGVATISLRAGTTQGAGRVTASYSDGDVSATQTLGFSSLGDDVGESEVQLVLSLTDIQGNPIDTISAASSGRLTALVSGIVKPTIVTFETSKGSIPIDTAVTNAQGLASVDIYAGDDLGAGMVKASLESGEYGETVIIIGATNLRMGSGDPFQEGIANVSLDQISAGGTATVSVQIVDESGAPFTDSVEVNFNSGCAGNNRATISSPVLAVGGIASSTYRAEGCVGDDPITVSANPGGNSLAANASINVLAADVGSIVFESALPERLGIKGTGGVEQSVLTFKVLDSNGNPVANESVSFALNTSLGGISLNPVTTQSDDQGLVKTTINTGTVATSVRVTATVDNSTPAISSQSNLLTISTGIADQDSFSLAASDLNVEGWNEDGTEVTITARLADAFNNPVDDGTAVSFITEGGSIESNCVTKNGVCSVKWVSQNPRPHGASFADIDNTLSPGPGPVLGQPYAGRVTIVAHAIGEESFPDLNGNGRFDAEEMNQFLNGTDVAGNPYDLDEAFVDKNEDGIFQNEPGAQPGGDNERLIDFNENGVFDKADGKYNGVLCSEPAHAGCSADQKSITVRQSIVLIMSGSRAYASVPLINNDPSLSSIELEGKETATVSLYISDLNNQPMPSGTTVTFKTTVGSIVTKSSFVWPKENINSATEFSVLVEGATTDGSGVLSVEVTTPGGVTTEVAVIPIIITGN
ncbi:Ig-like domain-containing protein [Paraferrimonas haliotis]|uniref:Big-1 domain-containing protein n=1 Tax=Paraferrimonas haliotis TaxID=2013866 RepID=A0AA37WYU4_9GAMM|nr:Ig-like domain-containing protein [Paraferrimonas haliotis]GLS84155.1 hypothetical protein GCM10007894_21320 [Paraferrimonas haliotis]